MKILFIIFLIPVVFSCKDNKPVNEYVKFTLDIPMKFEPSRDTINIGDTFYFSTDIGDTLLELNSGNEYLIKNFQFDNWLEVKKLVNRNNQITNQALGSGAFRFFSMSGQVFWDTSSAQSKVIFEKQSGGRHSCRIGVIAAKRGVFSFHFFYSPPFDRQFNILPYINLGSNESGGRRIAQVEFIRYAINDSITNHFNIFRDNCQLTLDPYNSHWHNRFLYYTVVVR